MITNKQFDGFVAKLKEEFRFDTYWQKLCLKVDKLAEEVKKGDKLK